MGRKLGADDGAAFGRLIADMRREAQAQPLVRLIDACETIGDRLRAAEADDRLAASYPFLTMLSTAVCGWLMERQGRIAAGGSGPFMTMKVAVARFYVDQIVPEALGLEAAATATAEPLYALDAETLAA